MRIDEAANNAALEQSSMGPELSRAYLTRREALAARAGDLGGVELMRAYSDLTDALVARIYDIASEGCPPDDLAVAAVGGYGRREMSPFSDVDVTFIVGAGDEESTEPIVKRAFRLLMDVLDQSGINVGYSYRRMDDVENLPLETQTALLDARRVIGSAALFDAFEAALRKAIVPAAFVIGHIESRTGRRGDSRTPFVVEPDVKEGDGGLRDLHAARPESVRGGGPALDG